MNIILTIKKGTNESNQDFVERVLKLISMGIVCFRINIKFDEKYIINYLIDLRESLSSIKKLCKLEVEFIIDVPYPKKKNRIFASDDKLISLNAGELIEIGLTEFTNGCKFYIENLNNEIFNIGEKFLIDDGKGVLIIHDLKFDRLILKAINKVDLYNGKSFIYRNIVCIVECDYSDIVYSLLSNLNCNKYMLSFVENKNEIINFKKKISNKNITIYSKIETIEGIKNMIEIINNSDGVVVARGDLGINTYKECNFLEIQNRICLETKRQKKDLIIATDILNSFINQNFPIRSELIDFYIIKKNNTDYIVITGGFQYTNNEHSLRQLILFVTNN